jgi:hypothetical protein
MTSQAILIHSASVEEWRHYALISKAEVLAESATNESKPPVQSAKMPNVMCWGFHYLALLGGKHLFGHHR